MRIRILAIAALLITGLVAAPATAAEKRDDVWVGQVVKHHRHFDYRGSACPTSAEMCIKVLANYRIVPLTSKAAAGLRKMSDGNGNARLVGYKRPTKNKNHNGTLYVRRVDRAQPDPTT
jgi:hypothetical protein